MGLNGCCSCFLAYFLVSTPIAIAVPNVAAADSGVRVVAGTSGGFADGAHRAACVDSATDGDAMVA